MKRLKTDSDLYERIIEAENILYELGISISYGFSSEGIIIRDLKSGMELRTSEQEMSFPRSIDTEFILNGD